MSERYVKDILEKLEEIEKLHSKLRTLVPRVRNYEAENVSTAVKNLPKNENERPIEEKNKQIPETLRNLCKSSKANIRKLFTLFGRDSNISKDNKWRKLKSSSMDFARKHWQDKKDKIKNFLSSVIESDIILVSRAAQTSDNEQLDTNIKNEEKEFASDQLPKKRKRTVHDQLERLLEHFNYSRDSDVANENRVSTHRHGLGENDPRRVQKVFSFPDEQSETLRIVSSAERVSINNGKGFLDNRTQKFLRKN